MRLRDLLPSARNQSRELSSGPDCGEYRRNLDEDGEDCCKGDGQAQRHRSRESAEQTRTSQRQQELANTYDQGYQQRPQEGADPHPAFLEFREDRIAKERRGPGSPGTRRLAESP
jgi:hypothetical protein